MPATLVRPKPSITIVPRSVFTPSASSPRFSILPTTPTAEMTRSASIVCFAPWASSTVATTESFFFSTPPTFAPVIILIPCFSKRLRAKAALSSSSNGRHCGNTSTTVPSAAGRRPVVLGGRHVVIDFGRAQQCLGRDAAPVEADAAELIALDDGGLEAELRRPDRGHVSARPGADHQDVKTGFRHPALLFTRFPAA